MKDQQKLELTFWMNMPSFYQADLFRALVASEEIDLKVIFARRLTADREQLGWKDETKGFPHRTLANRFGPWEALRIAWSERRRLHVVAGIWAEPSFAIALCVLAFVRSRFVVYAEAPDPRHAATGIRPLLRKFASWVAKRALGMLAVSRFATSFYPELGFNPERVYPFGYFRAGDDRQIKLGRSTRGERTEVVFVGQLIHRKGVDLLLDALVPLFDQYSDLFLSVIGGGGEAERLESCARNLGIQDRVTFEGTVSSDRIRPRLASADAVVLPSRWDGWGMVVNEALSAGVPVLVSDRCGAADLVQHGVNGYVFRSEDVEALRECLRKVLDSGDERLAMQAAALSTARAVAAEAAAPYLIECLKHMTGASEVRPIPPWARVLAQNANH